MYKVTDLSWEFVLGAYYKLVNIDNGWISFIS